jgi:ribonuclease T2
MVFRRPDGSLAGGLTSRLAARVLAPLLLAAPGPALAQAYQCSIPAGSIVVPSIEGGTEVRARVTGYTLAASWSPEYCRTRARSVSDARQCSGRSGRFGMVLHGLWPEGAGRSPQWCGTARRPNAADLRPLMCASPSARLLAHEWAKHGSCMTRRPARYFALQMELWTAIRWPDFDRLSRSRRLTAGELRRLIEEANPRWKAGGIGIQVNRRGWLEGVRLCYDLDYRPRPCRPGQLGPADGARVLIWRGLL